MKMDKIEKLIISPEGTRNGTEINVGAIKVEIKIIEAEPCEVFFFGTFSRRVKNFEYATYQFETRFMIGCFEVRGGVFVPTSRIISATIVKRANYWWPSDWGNTEQPEPDRPTL